MMRGQDRYIIVFSAVDRELLHACFDRSILKIFVISPFAVTLDSEISNTCVSCPVDYKYLLERIFGTEHYLNITIEH